METLQLTCECCGAPMRLIDPLHAKCPYCGHEVVYREPKNDALTQALNRANELRAESRFADAILEYKLILKENPNDAEALWGLVLSEYGIEYVKDPRTGRYVPTCHRLSKTNILENANYLRALENASEDQRTEYEARAAELDKLHKNILKRTQEAEDFDIFISFKSTDAEGRPTRDAGIARNIYDELKKRGFKVFFSDVTLNNMLFSDYEPIIFRALYSCKFFILVATQEEYIQAPWVKNEWSRFEERMQEERLSGVACAVFDGGHVRDLPMFLRAQGVDLRRHSAGGYEVGIADSIEKKLGRSEKSKEEEAILKQIEEQKKQADENARRQRELEEQLRNMRRTGEEGEPRGGSATIVSLLVRARQEAEESNFEKTRSFYERVLEASPENVDAWWGLFLSAFKVNDENSLLSKLNADLLQAIESNRNYRAAVRYMTDEFRPRYEGFLAEIHNPQRWWDLFLSDFKVSDENSLLSKLNADFPQTIESNRNYKLAVKYMTDEFRPRYEGFLAEIHNPQRWWDLFLSDFLVSTEEKFLERLSADIYLNYEKDACYINAKKYADEEFAKKIERFDRSVREPKVWLRSTVTAIGFDTWDAFLDSLTTETLSLLCETEEYRNLIEFQNAHPDEEVAAALSALDGRVRERLIPSLEKQKSENATALDLFSRTFEVKRNECLQEIKKLKRRNAQNANDIQVLSSRKSKYEKKKMGFKDRLIIGGILFSLLWLGFYILSAVPLGGVKFYSSLPYWLAWGVKICMRINNDPEELRRIAEAFIFIWLLFPINSICYGLLSYFVWELLSMPFSLARSHKLSSVIARLEIFDREIAENEEKIARYNATIETNEQNRQIGSLKWTKPIEELERQLQICRSYLSGDLSAPEPRMAETSG